jgi:hypothetical protein
MKIFILNSTLIVRWLWCRWEEPLDHRESKILKFNNIWPMLPLIINSNNKKKMLWILLDIVGKVREVLIARIRIHLSKISKSVLFKKVHQKIALLIIQLKEKELKEAQELDKAKEMRIAKRHNQESKQYQLKFLSHKSNKLCLMRTSIISLEETYI